MTACRTETVPDQGYDVVIGPVFFDQARYSSKLFQDHSRSTRQHAGHAFPPEFTKFPGQGIGAETALADHFGGHAHAQFFVFRAARDKGQVGVGVAVDQSRSQGFSGGVDFLWGAAVYSGVYLDDAVFFNRQVGPVGRAPVPSIISASWIIRS